MEKRCPHHDLDAFKRVCGDVRSLSITRSARVDAAAMGFDPSMIAATVRAVAPSMFYKSMTSHDDPREWQDVYHVPTRTGRVIYLKFKAGLIAAFTILSSKER